MKTSIINFSTKEQSFLSNSQCLTPDEKAVFLAAAKVFNRNLASLPLGERPDSMTRSLWMLTGRASSSPCFMPKQNMTPGLLGLWWRRLRAAVVSTVIDNFR